MGRPTNFWVFSDLLLDVPMKGSKESNWFALSRWNGTRRTSTADLREMFLDVEKLVEKQLTTLHIKKEKNND